MSRKTRSGECSWMSATASRPLPASPTSSMSGSAARRMRRFCRASGSSSTTSVLIFLFAFAIVAFGSPLSLGRREPQGDGERRLDAAALAVADGEAVAHAVELFEAGARVRQPDAPARRVRLRPVFAQARPVVVDLDAQEPVFQLGAHADRARRGAARDAVADGVLDERLEDETGDERVERLG